LERDQRLIHQCGGQAEHLADRDVIVGADLLGHL